MLGRQETERLREQQKQAAATKIQSGMDWFLFTQSSSSCHVHIYTLLSLQYLEVFLQDETIKELYKGV